MNSTRLVLGSFAPGLRVLALLGAVACGASGPDLMTPQTGSGKYSHQSFLPQAYAQDATARWPLIIALHGAGGLIPSDNLIEIQAKRDPAFPFVVVVPSTSNGWNDALLNATFEDAIAKYRIDLDRIYLTGLSMGAYGAWSFAAKYPHRFAALALVAGGGTPADACTIKHLPVWAFHNRTDTTVPISESQNTISALVACGAQPIVTVYDDSPPGTFNHNAWQRAWTTPELYTWFLSKRRVP